MRVLTAITPTEPEREDPQTRPPVTKIPAAVKPPPPPQQSAVSADINLPAVTLEGQVPTDIGFQSIDTYVVQPVVIDDRDTQPLYPPTPTYPEAALRRGIEGKCDVTLDVDTRGKPFNVRAVCTDRVFRREAERAVSKVEFAPKIVRGQVSERRNVVYPLDFNLADER